MTPLRLILLSLIAPLAVRASTALDFESGVPAGWSGTAGRWAATATRFKSGASSLGWAWNGRGATLEWHDAAAFGTRQAKSGFACWVYSERPLAARMKFELLDGGEAVAHGWFWMEFTGWRLLGAGDAQLGLGPGRTVDGIRFHAPEGVGDGRLFFDDFTPLLEFQAPRTPQMPWAGQDAGPDDFRKVEIHPDDPSFNRPWLPKRPAAASAREIQDIATLSTGLLPARKGPGRGLAAGQLDGLRKTVADYRIRREGGRITGRAIDGGTAVKPAGFIPYGDYLKTCEAVKNAWFQAREEAETAELGNMFTDLAAHLVDQGWAPGIRLGPWDNYPGNAIACFYSMRGVLVEAGLARPVAEALMDHFGSHGPGDYCVEKPSSSMDGLGYWHRELYACALMFPTAEEQVQHLRIARRFLSMAMVQPDTIGPDGSTYHHDGFHYAYASYNLPRLVQVLKVAAPTSFGVTAEALERLRLHVRVLAPTFSAGQQAYNLGMRAGTPLGSGGVINVARELALMGTPDGGQKPDRAMAAICLWLMADEKGGNPPEFDRQPFKDWLAAGIRPAIPPDQVTMNGSPLAVHRGEGWLASIAGMSSFWRGLEIYGWTQSNNYGRFARHGSLVITAGGSPPSLAASGWSTEGWNWCHFPGTTALRVAQPRDLFDGYAMYGNGTPFAGGTSLGADGIWGIDFTGTGTRFRKSYFCFGRHITALTSGISADRKDTSAPVVTTLFQNARLPQDAPLVLDGEPLDGFPIDRTLTFESPHWLIDNQRNGYLIAAGNDPLHLRAQEQEWLYFVEKSLVDRNANPFSGGVTYQNFRGRLKDLAEIEKFYQPSRGRFALAWFDHGPQPAAASCAYTVVVRTDPAEMRALAARPAGRVLQSDERAHIVNDLPSGAFGYVLFEPAAALPAGPLRSASEPCFVMLRPDGSGLEASLAYTMRKNADPYPAVEIRLTIAGRWTATGRQVASESGSDVTTLRIRPRDNTPLRWRMEP